MITRCQTVPRTPNPYQTRLRPFSTSFSELGYEYTTGRAIFSQLISRFVKFICLVYVFLQLRTYTSLYNRNYLGLFRGIHRWSPWGVGGGGGTLIFSYIRRLSPFFWGQIFEFQYFFWVFRKMNIFLGINILWIFFGVIPKLD